MVVITMAWQKVTKLPVPHILLIIAEYNSVFLRVKRVILV